MIKKVKPALDFSWMTDEVIVRMNHVRFRANLEDLTREQWISLLSRWQQKEIDAIKWYCTTY